MSRSFSIAGLFLASTMLCGVAASAFADDLVTADRVGKADAPNTLVFRTNPDFTQTSPTPSQATGFKTLFQSFAEKHPDWQIQFQYFTPDIGGEHARMLEQARAGRAPDCATVDSFQLALFVKNGVLAPVDQYNRVGLMERWSDACLTARCHETAPVARQLHGSRALL